MLFEVSVSVLVIVVTVILLIIFKMTRKPKMLEGIPTGKNNSIFGRTTVMLAGLRTHKEQLKFTEEYGSFSQFNMFGLLFVVVSDKRILKAVMKNIDDKPFALTDDGNSPWGVKSTFLPDTFNLTTGKAWQLRRSSFKHSFTSTSLRHFDDIILGCVSKLSSKVEEHAKSGKVLTIDKLFGKMTIDIICEVAFAFKINALDNSDLSEEMNSAMKLLMENAFTAFLPYASVLKKFFVFYNSFKNFENGRDRVYNFNRLILRHLIQKEKEGTLPEDCLGKSILEFMRQPGITEDNVMSEIGVIFMAGHETTAHSLSFFIYALARHPEIQRKAQEAVDSWVVKDSNSSAIPPYVEAVIKESMRKYPVAPRIERRLKNDKGYFLDLNKIPQFAEKKVFLPNNTNVVVDILSLHCSEDNWGPDAKEFKPERWMDPSKPLLSSPSVFSGGSDNAEDISFMPFANGSRNCMGMNMALTEIRLTAVELLKKFDFELINDDFRDEMNFREFTFTMRPKDEMPVKVTLRK